MKLLYLITGNYLSTKNSGVYSKILAKAKALKETNIQVEVVEISDHKEEQINAYCRIINAQDADPVQSAEKYLHEKGAEFDKILFRYPYAGPQLLHLVKKHGKKIYFEHNTFEIEEATLVQQKHFRSLPFSLSPSYLSYWYKSHISKSTAEKELGGEILKYAAGGVCVTKELAAYEIKKCPGYKTFVVSNGADDAVDFVKQVPAFSNTLKTFMLVGDDAPWQGFERIIAGLKNYKNKSTGIEVNMIGLNKPAIDIKGLPPNCRLIFSPASKNYFTENKLEEYHLAFSTLALYKKGMQEAASLKLRDCMLRGFPVVLAYNDTDVSSNSSFTPYTLQFVNDNSAINFDKILAFYKNVRAIENYPARVRELATNTFSYKIKAEQLKAILESN